MRTAGGSLRVQSHFNKSKTLRFGFVVELFGGWNPESLPAIRRIGSIVNGVRGGTYSEPPLATPFSYSI